MVTVKVVWRDTGKPAEGKKVSVSFDGITRGVSRDEFTNHNGEAHFDVQPGHGKIFVGGSVVREGRIEGQTVVYL